jgi:hypothetical protein
MPVHDWAVVNIPSVTSEYCNVQDGSKENFALAKFKHLQLQKNEDYKAKDITGFVICDVGKCVLQVNESEI